MVHTRSQKMSVSSITEIIDEKFEEFKKSVLAEVKKEIDLMVTNEKEQIAEFILSKKKEVVKDCENMELISSVEVIKQHVKILRGENVALRNEIHGLRVEVDNLEQYTRRPNLRLYGMTIQENETSKMVEEEVVKMLNDMPEITDCIKLDRAHRIGKGKTDKNGQKSQPVIVRFRSFHDRTAVYKARSTIKSRFKLGVSLDLTKLRLDLLNRAKDMTGDVDGIKFVYSDINCKLRAFTASGKHEHFTSVEGLQDIIKNSS